MATTIERLRRAVTRQGNRKTEHIGAPALTWRAAMRHRVAVLAIVLGLWAAAIQTRLVYLQVIDRADLVDRAARQQLNTKKLPAKRGDIVDRHGRILATSVDADTVIAVPSAIDDERGTVTKLCAVFTNCTAKERQDLIDRLKRQRNFAYIRRQVTPAEAQQIRALNLDGIGWLKESRRYYPKTELASHLLGFVGLDGKGLGGLEAAYDSQIRGKDGQAIVHADARRHVYDRSEKAPTMGATIELTVDEYLQHIAEKELHAGVLENKAAGGSVVMMNPRTGEILAMANEPTFNPNLYRDASEFERRNRAVQDLYEPGSTFKVVTASAAIEEHLMPVDTLIDTSGGQIHIGSRVVTDTHDYGLLSFTDVIVKSSNVGAIRIGLKLGTERLSDYVQKFGFGRPISPDFPAESPGIVWDRAKWTESALASVSMGYQVGVTPLQMATAVSAVANRGEYVEPRVVRAVYRDGRRYEVRPRVLRSTIAPETASALTTIMEQVVERGTGTIARIPGYAVAGKTGTANKLANGRYTSDTYASFVGFLPARNPAVTILVMLDSPRGPNGHFGGPVSAPIFRRIAEATLRYQGIAPTVNPAPPVLVAGDDAREPSETPLPVVDVLRSAAARETPGLVPNLAGLSAREATRRLMKVGMSARLAGDGFVIDQEPAAGTPIADGQECRLTLVRAGHRQTVESMQP